MLHDEEKKFIEYWKKNKTREHQLLRQLYIGLPIGILTGAAIILSLTSGWYTRANMVAGSQLSWSTLITAIIAIVIFISVFYKKHQWDMNQQRYEELMKRENEIADYSNKKEAVPE